MTKKSPTKSTHVERSQMGSKEIKGDSYAGDQGYMGRGSSVGDLWVIKNNELIHDQDSMIKRTTTKFISNELLLLGT